MITVFLQTCHFSRSIRSTNFAQIVLQISLISNFISNNTIASLAASSDRAIKGDSPQLQIAHLLFGMLLFTAVFTPTFQPN
jgi:hypothetical protein